MLNRSVCMIQWDGDTSQVDRVDFEITPMIGANRKTVRAATYRQKRNYLAIRNTPRCDCKINAIVRYTDGEVEVVDPIVVKQGVPVYPRVYFSVKTTHDLSIPKGASYRSNGSSVTFPERMLLPGNTEMVVKLVYAGNTGMSFKYSDMMLSITRDSDYVPQLGEYDGSDVVKCGIFVDGTFPTPLVKSYEPLRGYKN